MAIVRFSGPPDGPHPYESDVYVYEDVEGGYTCCACPFDPMKWFKAEFLVDMGHHLLKHLEAGHKVPDYAVRECLTGVRTWLDPTIAEMMAMMQQDPQAKIVSNDADVPEDRRIDHRQVAEMLRESGVDLPPDFKLQ